MNKNLFQTLNHRSYENALKSSLPIHKVEAKNKFLELAGDLEEIRCFICDNSSFDLISSYDRYGFEYPSGICKKCGNLQQIAYYSNNDINLFYSRFYRDIYDGRSPEDLFDFQLNTSGKKIGYFLKHNVSGSQKILEVGCGAGGILWNLSHMGFEVTGIDFDERYLDFAASKGIEVFNGDIDLIINKKITFDIIVLNHVLEHIVDPQKFLFQLKKVLNTSGLVFIEVPTLESIRDGAYDCDLLQFFQNAHVCHYSRSHLIALCQKSGFKVSATDGNMFLFKNESEESLTSQFNIPELRSRQIDLLLKIEKRHGSFLTKISKLLRRGRAIISVLLRRSKSLVIK